MMLNSLQKKSLRMDEREALDAVASFPSEKQGRKPEFAINVKDIKWNVERRTIYIKNRTVVLTSTEFQLLYPLRDGAPITYANLASIVYHCSMDAKVRVMLDKHIDRIRSKIRGTGIYIYCVLGYGYMIFPEHWSNECAPVL